MKCLDMAFVGDGRHQPVQFTNMRGTASSLWLFETSCQSLGVMAVAPFAPQGEGLRSLEGRRQEAGRACF